MGRRPTGRKDATADGKIAITVVAKVPLVERIDALADRNASTRSATAARLLEEGLAAREAREAA
jgi:hypothetical protein